MVADALAQRGAHEHEAHLLESELEQCDTAPAEIDDSEWAEEMLRLTRRNPAHTEFELLGTATGTMEVGPTIS